jgi:hypothetical protein
MKEELKKAKALLTILRDKGHKLIKANFEKNELIDELRRQLSFYETRFYLNSVNEVKRRSDSNERNRNLMAPVAPQKDKGRKIEAEEQDPTYQVNVSFLEESNIMDVSKVNKQSLMKRKRKNKESISVSVNQKDTFVKKASLQAFNIEEEAKVSRVNSQELDGLEEEVLDHKERFNVEESKGYLRQLAKELLMDMNSRAKFAFAKMRNQKFIDIGLLPTPVVKIDRSLSAPGFTFKKAGRSPTDNLLDQTLMLDRAGGQYNGLNDDYSIDCDFDEFKKFLLK